MPIDADPDPEAVPAAAAPGAAADVVGSYRSQLTPGEDVIDTPTWAGSVPPVNGVAPRVRVGRSRWFNLLWLLPIGFGLLLVAVAVAKGLRAEPWMQRFIGHYPGTMTGAVPAGATGFSSWVRLQHLFNASS